MFKVIAIPILLLALFELYSCQQASSDFDCSDRPDGFFFWWACGSYGVCKHGTYYQIDCVNGTSFDRRKRECALNERGVTFPCQGRDCSHDAGHGHRYPELDSDPLDGLPPCTFYYTCAHKHYMGHQMCTPGTVYDEPQQKCQHPSLVAPPCGYFKEEAL